MCGAASLQRLPRGQDRARPARLTDQPLQGMLRSPRRMGGAPGRGPASGGGYKGTGSQEVLGCHMRELKNHKGASTVEP